MTSVGLSTQLKAVRKADVPKEEEEDISQADNLQGLDASDAPQGPGLLGRPVEFGLTPPFSLSLSFSLCVSVSACTHTRTRILLFFFLWGNVTNNIYIYI